MAVNKVILVGNVGKDPEVRYLDNDVSVANFTLATTDRGFTTRSGQEIPEKTEWHNIVVWRGLAKLAENYITKGMKLYIEGKIRTRSWEDQSGVKRYSTEIHADNIELPGRPSDSAATSPATSADNAASPAMVPTPTPTPVPTSNPIADFDIPDGSADDLPF